MQVFTQEKPGGGSARSRHCKGTQGNENMCKQLSRNQFLVRLRVAAALDGLAQRHWHAAGEGDEERFPPAGCGQR
jgi:hypothetical protein